MTDSETGNTSSAPDTANQGIVYLLENGAFEAPVIKIGKTGRNGSDLATRIRTLNTAVPLAFTCYRASLVNDAVGIERKLHQVFYPAKRQWRGEFYEVEPWRVMLVLGDYEILDMTSFAPTLSSEDSQSINATVKEKEKLATSTFEMLGLPVGTKLTLTGSSEIECEIANGLTSVFYEGKEYALSTLATQLKQAPYGLQGLRHWEFEGESLIQRRNKIIEQQSPSS
jgi:hypothetical protein